MGGRFEISEGRRSRIVFAFAVQSSYRIASSYIRFCIRDHIYLLVHVWLFGASFSDIRRASHPRRTRLNICIFVPVLTLTFINVFMLSFMSVF